MWENQHSLDLSFNQFKKLIEDKLLLFYKNQWLENMQNSSKCFFYEEFKKVLTFEKYLINTDVSVRYFLAKYRTTNHRLPIEQGMIDNVEKV